MIRAIKEESSDEDSENDGSTLVTLDVGELLLIKRSLYVIRAPYEDSQREQILNSRCTIGRKVCGLNRDGRSSTNATSMTLIDKLQILTIEHPLPYFFQWLGLNDEVTASRQALILFSIGPYYGEVLCNVLPMDACHLLLGRPWLYDNYVNCDGRLIHIHLSTMAKDSHWPLYLHLNLTKLNQGMKIRKNPYKSEI